MPTDKIIPIIIMVIGVIGCVICLVMSNKEQRKQATNTQLNDKYNKLWEQNN